MRLTFITLASVCSLVLIVGCARKKDAPPQARNSPSTQPVAPTNPAMPPLVPVANLTPPAPIASMMMIDQAAQWFPPARLRLTSSGGKVIARLYSDDPKGVLTGNETVNSYDMIMVLPDISDPADISGKVWVGHSASMERQDPKYGIFLNNQQDVLQPMDVTVSFEGLSPRISVSVRGTFSSFHISEQTPNPAPTMVRVIGFLDATVLDK